MKTVRRCAFCSTEIKNGKKLCNECEGLRQMKYCRSLVKFERVRAKYNERHRLGLSYGQFVLLTRRIDERRRQCDKQAEKARVKKDKTVV